jgi:deoxyribodipyrimidine photo-lyase
MQGHERGLVWFRRDLRSYDHAALYHALKSSRAVYCVFVFDTEILDGLPRRDRRVEFIRESVSELRAALERLGGGLVIAHGRSRAEIPRLARQLGAQAVFINHDYEPAALERDRAVQLALAHAGIAFHTFKDQVVFEKDEVTTRAGRPFAVFTAYKNAWLERLRPFYLAAYPVEKYARSLVRPPPSRMPALEELGFERTNIRELKLPTGMSGGKAWLEEFLSRIERYRERRDYPALRGPSYLSVHLRFGTVSIRELARAAWERGKQGAERGKAKAGSEGRHRAQGAATWLSELIWRDFYAMLLYHHPHVVEHAFLPQFDAIRFPNRQNLFDAWCEGRTGYPLVDAAMRQIDQTGYMHNRLRMVAASFLVKDLQVDWRWGERYFARCLNDYDLASNNGGWQWAASTGCDAQPYFRIFNPVTQSERFDPEGKFIRLYLPELSRVADEHIHAPWRMSPERRAACGVIIGRDYPAPIVDHAQARKATLELYALAKRVSATGVDS